MRAEVLTAWRKQIEEAVRVQFPEFEPVTKRVRGEPRWMLKYIWHPRARLWCYIAFRPLNSEAFDALVGWSTSDRFPIADGPTGVAPQDIWNFDAPHVIDWSLTFVPRNGAAHWSFWNPSDAIRDNPTEFAKAYAAHFMRALSPQEADDLVRPAIELGIAEVRDYGIPYLQRRAAYGA
jgi:hypothetical protein